MAFTLRDRGADAEPVAHFLNRILFCFFAQHAGLLPVGIVGQVLNAGKSCPDRGTEMLRALFSVMKRGGTFGPHVIEWFNGNLFDSSDTLPLAAEDIDALLSIAEMDWSAVEPSIFGTLFERGLDPRKRAQIGAHYTDVESIKRVITPVVIEPITIRWIESRGRIESLIDKGKVESAQRVFDEFLTYLGGYRILDPACGSGNFLYLALQSLKDLEHASSLEAEQLGLSVPRGSMRCGVQCVHGIELNTVAAELARVTVWIGEIQWMLHHGLQPSRNPILKSLETIECKDAVVAENGDRPQWPVASAIVGNPPFLGNKRMITELGESYTSRLRFAYRDSLPGGVDLVAYWFEQARQQIEQKRCERAGLVATQSIRKGANRSVLDRIVSQVPIFDAWRDEPWVNEGAAVRVSIVAFGAQVGPARLDGKRVAGINPDLSIKGPGSVNLTAAKPLTENRGVCFMGTSKVGDFDVTGDLAREWLRVPNPHGRPNSEVVRPWANGQEITGRPADKWIIDFGVEMSERLASMYEAPFAYVKRHVRPARQDQRRDAYRKRWWIHAESRPGLRAALRGISRYIATPRVAKHRVFVWLSSSVLPDSRLFAICRDDDATLGVLSSRLHTVWATANASRHGKGNDPTYNAGDCFETFPFPDLADHARETIETAAVTLDELRENWLNPPEWTERVPEVNPIFPDRIIPKEGHGQHLAHRTLTDLYNLRPEWLVRAHQELDEAVARAYGWKDYTAQLADVEILSRLLDLNQKRSIDLVTMAATPRSNNRFEDVLARRLVLTETVIHRLRDDPNLGRTKLAKVFYLADMRAGLELKMKYYREAAGPLDARALYNPRIGIEALGRQRDLFYARPDGRAVRYRLGKASTGVDRRAREIFGGQFDEISRVIDLMRPLSTDQSEIVSTLYACWNDLLIDSRSPNDDAIVNEFRTRWHKQKERFAPARLLIALQWMRKNHMTPGGKGSHTSMFAQAADPPVRSRPRASSKTKALA
ncbi:MAG TPA: DNA methyltransferase [Usitatibacter sp.]|nr:DNA methyltransferase [Usitatibacter sp.]